MRNEGLRIDLTESATDTFFESGSAKMSAAGSDLLKNLAQELGELPNHVAIEGHTDSKPILPPRHTRTECSAKTDDAERLSRRSCGAGALICGPAAAQSRCAA